MYTYIYIYIYVIHIYIYIYTYTHIHIVCRPPRRAPRGRRLRRRETGGDCYYAIMQYTKIIIVVIHYNTLIQYNTL